MHRRPHRIDSNSSRRFLLRLALIVVLLIVGLQSIQFYVDILWFQSLGYESVYWYGLKAQAVVFIIFAAVTAGALWILFRSVTPAPNTNRLPFIEIGGETIMLPNISSFKRFELAAASVLGLFFGLAFSSDWNQYALFFNRVALPNEVTDPVFGRSLSFYFFTLPVVQSICGWFLAVSFIGLLAAAFLSLTNVAARFKGISLALSVFLVALAAQTYVRRYMLIVADHNLFTGVRYVDDHLVIPGLWFVMTALLLGAVIAALNAREGRLRYIVAALAMPALTYVVVGVLAEQYITAFVVRPNELARETPYIRRAIDFTRQAYLLDRSQEVLFEPTVTNAVFDAAAHADTLDNIRLWDWRALQATLRQIQEIRTYYDFPDVDIDRYRLGGKLQAMMLATRELSLNKLPAGSRNWVNERLIYTHGYGVTMNPVSRFTNEGQPELALFNMPVESTNPDLHVIRPEIYFGESTDWPVYVKTRQKEFNFPEGDANNYTNYEGSGGIRMGSFLRRLVLAWAVGDLTKVPFSDDITSDSALLIHRNLKERVSTLAPFLLFDDDPYIVVGADGRLYWIIDAFTSSDQYPYSRHLALGNSSVNYIRNSVKAVIDAYNGATSFYIFDPEDPIILAYQRTFPALFRAASDMPDFLRSHVRYPEFLFQIQATMYATYHVGNEQVFYNREDVWTIAQQGRSQAGQQGAQNIEASYVLMRIPGEKELEFVSVLPFTPANRNNLIGWMAARSDGDAYGTLRAYHLPKTRFTDGPLQIQARIDQDPQLSSQLTLWNQQGSTVIRGNLLVIPLDNTLFFAEPMYLQAERSPMPELRLVVLATQDRLAFAQRFPEALRLLLQGRTVPPAISKTPVAPTSPIEAQPSAARSLIDRANQALTDYQHLTSEGKLGEAGLKLDELKRALEELNRSKVP
jgi:uncharacterized membrane protein (UPF0182 family)